MWINRKKRTIILFILTISSVILVSSSFATPNSTQQSTKGFVAAKTTVPLNLTNNQVDSFWDQINDTFANVSELGDNGDGYAKFANNETHLYGLFVTLKSSDWISIEFEPEPSECMLNLHDGWSFYVDGSTGEVIAKDINFMGTKIPDDDTTQDLSMEYIISEDKVYIEVVRSFNTNDADGYDITYQNGTSILVQFASKNAHFGSHTKYFLFITDSTIGQPNTPPDIEIPVDLNQIKFTLLAFVPVGVFGFVIIHLLRRVIFSPIEHDYTRIATNGKDLPPSFKQRWNQIFSKE